MNLVSVTAGASPIQAPALDRRRRVSLIAGANAFVVAGCRFNYLTSTSYNGLHCVSPPLKDPLKWGVVDSLQPTLRWEGDPNPDTQYDLRVWEAGPGSVSLPPLLPGGTVTWKDPTGN